MAAKQDFLSHFDSMQRVLLDPYPLNFRKLIAAHYRLIGAVDLMYFSGVLSSSEADKLKDTVHDLFPLPSADLQDLGFQEVV